MKKHIRTVVALCMAAFMPVAYAQIPLVIDNSINRIIYSEDFESYSVGQNPDMLITYNAPYTTVEKSDAEYGKSLTFNCSDNMAAAKFFDEDLNRGVYRFSFDIKAESKGKSTVMRVYNRNLGKQMYSDSGMYQIFSYRDGNIGFYDPIHFWDAVSEAQYEVDEWNHIDMWFDMDNRKLYHYINGEYVRQVAINMDLDKLGGFLFAPEGKDAGSVMMDNFMLTEVKYADALGIPVEQIPEPLRGALDISVTSERVGHIFTKNEEAEFEVHLKNRTLEQQKGKVEATAFDSSGNVITSEAWNVDISGEGVSSHKMEIKQKVFGCNTLVIKASIGETISQKTVEWSRINSDKNTPKNDKMGASVHYTDSKRDAINGIRLISEAGFGRIRDEILWKYYEPEKGYYKIPDNMDKFVDLSNDANLDTLMILSYGNPLYGGSPPETEVEYQGFYDYCYELVRDLKGRVNRFEIWNEFNLVGHHTFNPKKLPPENYAKLLVNSYKAVKRANPDAEVIGMVTSGSPLDWIEKVLIAIDGEKCFDAVSVHPYSLGVSSEDAHLVSKGKGLRELMNKYGYTDTKLYISEIGWTTAGDPQEEFNQAMYEVRTYLLNDAYDLYDAIYIYDFQDDSYLTEGSIEYTFGLVRYWNNMVENPFAAKPAYAALANFNALVGTAEFEKVIDVGEDAYAYVYEKDSKKTIAFGAYEDSEIISLKLGTETADVYDMYGNMHTVYGINGCYTLQAGEKIQYIQGDFLTAQVCEPVWSLSDTKIKTTANSRILREEWGYEGLVMTDWWTRTCVTLEGEVSKNREYPIIAQNDVYMVNNDSESIAKEITDAVTAGKISRGELQRNAINICNVILSTPTFERYIDGDVVGSTKLPQISKMNIVGEYKNIFSGFELEINVENPCDHALQIEYSSNESELVQIPIKVYLNEQSAALFMLKGTGGNILTGLTGLYIMRGKNKIKIEFADKSVDIKNLKLYTSRVEA